VHGRLILSFNIAWLSFQSPVSRAVILFALPIPALEVLGYCHSSALADSLNLLFVQSRRAAIPRDELLNEVWGYDAAVSTRTVDVHVVWLRQKLEANQHHPQFILTIH